MPNTDQRDEKRFAVVMYGGVSLAIYMNGIAQELYRLVQATSEQVKIPRGSAKVYRDIANDLKTKFVIDILSGTSAGGINAVFLAKALAVGRRFEGVESIWVNTANIDGLINDRRGLGVGIAQQLLPNVLSTSALLNGNKMYADLFDALKEMDIKKGNKADAPEMDELDLYVTATDLEGRISPVEIMGEQVNEREHRHVFHLRKAPAAGSEKPVNHFDPDYNPFIAFVARSTSSFPVAFEPVQLEKLTEWKDLWRGFFKPIRSSQQGKGSDGFGSRVFADGGYLDNKPFSYAIQTIMARHTDHPVDRKLIYIEPSPEKISEKSPSPKENSVEPPDASENALKAFTLARYETIRQDLQLLKERNRLIERTSRILCGTEEDISKLGVKNQPPNVFDWENKDLREMINEQGFGYGGYFRLRVARLTDELSEIICRQAGMDLDSDGFLAVRNLVREWRDRKYAYYVDERASNNRGKKAPKQEKFTKFILNYDLGFHYRRLRFILSIIDRLLLEGPEREKILSARNFKDRPGDAPEFYASLRSYRTTICDYRKKVLNLQHSLFEAPSGETSELCKAVCGLRLVPETIVGLLYTSASDEARRRKAAEFLEEKGRMVAFERVLGVVKGKVEAVADVMEKCKVDLGLSGHSSRAKWSATQPKDWGLRVRWILQFYFRFFGHYDVVSYPLTQQTLLGEELDEVEIIRISPANAEQLGGTKYGNFGAFFDETWRNNDILRGRLDGAAGIIRALYPDEENADDLEKRNNFTEAAQEAIVQEWIDRYTEKEDFLAEVMTGSTESKRVTTQAAFSRLIRFGDGGIVREQIRNILMGKLGAKDFLDRFKRYAVNPSPSRELMARAITRLVHVFGKMLTGMAHKRGHSRLEKSWNYVAQAGAIAVSLVEVFLPGSWRELLIRRFLQVLMVLGMIMIVGGGFLKGSSLGQLGAYVFGAGLLLELIRVAFAHFLRTGRVTRLVILLLVVSILVLMVIGVIYAPDAVEDLVDGIKALMSNK